MKINVNQKDIEEFDKSKIGQVKNSYLKRVKITGILLIMFGLIWILLNIIFENKQIYEYITASISVIFGIYSEKDNQYIESDNVKFTYVKGTQVLFEFDVEIINGQVNITGAKVDFVK